LAILVLVSAGEIKYKNIQIVGGIYVKKSKKLLWMLLSALVVLVLAACGGDDDSATDSGTKGDSGGSTDSNAREVIIGGLWDLTGGTSDVGAPFAEGAEAYVGYINSKGIEGLNIKLIGKDYGYVIPEAQKLYQEHRDKAGVQAIIGFGTGDTEALRQQVAADEFPFVSGSLSENLKDTKESPYNFLVAASYSDQGRALLKWIKDNHEGGEPTVALLYNDTAFGRSPVEDMKAYAKEIGVKVVDEQVIDVKATEAQSQLLNMEKKNPDYAIIQQTWAATSTILRDAKTLEIDTQFMGLNWTTGEGLFDNVDAATAEGYMGVLINSMPGDDVPGMAEIEEYVTGKGKKMEDINQKFVQGWVTAKIMVEGIKKAAELYPDGDIKGAQIREGMESLTDLDLGGVAANVSYSADNHAGTKEIRIGVVKDGKWEAITDYISFED